MKKILTKSILIWFVLCGFLASAKTIESSFQTKSIREATPIDSTQISVFFAKYPKLVLYQSQMIALYNKQQYNFIWYDKNGRKEIADVLYNKINNLSEEGVQVVVPYKSELDELFQKTEKTFNSEDELMLTAFYLYYTNKVIQGVDDTKFAAMEWYSPRKKPCYLDYIDSLLVDPASLDKKERQFNQYYKLKQVLHKYRAIENNGGWAPIKMDSSFKSIKPGDSAVIVGKIRERLFMTGDIPTNSKSCVYGYELQKAILKYKKRNGFAPDKIILAKHIEEMNVPVSERIKTIMVNMERCRWIPADVTKAKEYIIVNIPAFQLNYFKNEKEVLTSRVVVGTKVNKTVVFSGMLSSIVFSPYWNVPKSIVEKEIIPAIKKDKHYLSKHNMEWHKDGIRQKPGPTNSLGLVKFIFPNNNNIYLHDTPSKELFDQEERAFSHGCIRVAKPTDLASLILEKDVNWTPEKIQEAMNCGKETWYTLLNKIPVHIGYFTAWVNEEGIVNFYKDIYERDKNLASILVEE